MRRILWRLSKRLRKLLASVRMCSAMKWPWVACFVRDILSLLPTALKISAASHCFQKRAAHAWIQCPTAGLVYFSSSASSSRDICLGDRCFICGASSGGCGCRARRSRTSRSGASSAWIAIERRAGRNLPSRRTGTRYSWSLRRDDLIAMRTLEVAGLVIILLIVLERFLDSSTSRSVPRIVSASS